MKARKRVGKVRGIVQEVDAISAGQRYWLRVCKACVPVRVSNGWKESKQAVCIHARDKCHVIRAIAIDAV